VRGVAEYITNHVSDGAGLNGRVSIPGTGRIHFSPRRPKQFWCPPSLLSNGYREIERRGCEAYHSHPSTTEVMNFGAVPPLPHMPSWTLTKLIMHRDSFIGGSGLGTTI
jgi:hypothetical protein